MYHSGLLYALICPSSFLSPKLDFRGQKCVSCVRFCPRKISNSSSGTHFGKSWFLDFILTFFSIFLQKTNRELPNLEHGLPKCVPEGQFQIYSSFERTRQKTSDKARFLFRIFIFTRQNFRFKVFSNRCSLSILFHTGHSGWLYSVWK